MAESEGRREPVLDGIRGIAILLVLFHHLVLYAGMSGEALFDRRVLRLAQATWLGVDVFFVLSGFLITGILYDTKSSPRFFRNFFGRRTLRIFPLYYGVLTVVFLAAPLLLGRPLFGVAEGGQIWYWTYLSNVDAALHDWREPLELGHFWSLAVEEQFYLVWPWVVFALGRSALLRVTVVCFISALLLRVAVPFVLDPLAAYTLMPMRMDALAAGAFLALMVRGPRGWAVVGRWPPWLCLAALGLLSAIFYWRRGLPELDPVVRTAGYSLVALATASLIAVAMTSSGDSWLPKALRSRLLVTMGMYSYGLYVFHQIILLTLRDRGFGTALFPTVWGSEIVGLLAFTVVGMAASALIAYASWHLYELPFLRLKRFFRYREPVDPAGAKADAAKPVPAQAP
jgi:peptidoglycan/LPS O-acetylase OafA/YrhL